MTLCQTEKLTTTDPGRENLRTHSRELLPTHIFSKWWGIKKINELLEKL